ncbi:hypothetical protein D3C86_1932310 [compost metagenome]
MFGEVIGYFFPGDGFRKHIQPKQLIPNEVVFLAPSAFLIESQCIMIAVGGHLHPFLGEIFG